VRRLVLAAAFIAAACSGNATSPEGDSGAQHQVEVGQTVTLKLGETAAVRGTAVTIKFSSVEADSRCPIDALCVWQGDAHIRLDLANVRGPVSKADVHTTLDPHSTEFAGYKITLKEVSPSRVSTEPVASREYSVKLEVTR